VRLGDEGEGAVCVNRDDNGDDQTDIVLGSLIEFLSEVRNGNTVLTESGADGGLGSSFSGGKLKFDITGNFLSHNYIPPNVV
jgi:hypothetical protein